MTESETDAKADDVEVEPDVEIDLDAPDAVAYDELVDTLGEEIVIEDLREVVKQRVRAMYDSREEIQAQLMQARQQAAQQQAAQVQQ